MKMIRQVALPSLRRTNGVGAICFDGWFSNEDQMPLKDAFPAAAKPALAREPKPGYTEGMIRVAGTIAIGEEGIHPRLRPGRAECQGTRSLTFYIAEKLLDRNK